MTISFLLATAFLVFLIYSLVVEPRLLQITHLEVAFPNLPPSFDGLRIAHLTDVHIRAVGYREKKAALLIRRLSPDLVVCTGDLFVSGRFSESSCRWLRDLSETSDLYMVLGNHDMGQWLSSSVVQRNLRGHAIRVLRNESLRVHRGNDHIAVIGLDDPSKGLADLEAARNPQEDPGLFKILLAHSPDIQAHLPHNEIDLILAGHTHGGQVCLPGLGPLGTHTRRSPRKTCRGLTQLSSRTVLYVSRGLGFSGLPLRFLCPPEIVSVILRRKTPTEAGQTDEHLPGAAVRFLDTTS